jgi:hypothetical protein
MLGSGPLEPGRGVVVVVVVVKTFQTLHPDTRDSE